MFEYTATQLKHLVSDTMLQSIGYKCEKINMAAKSKLITEMTKNEHTYITCMHICKI